MRRMAEITSIELGLVGIIKKTLTETARRLQSEGAMDNRRWTHDCLNSLVAIGRQIGYGVCPEPDIMKGEWLYDLIWYTEEECEWPNRVTDVVLVLESEWSQKLCDIRYDFQKLVQAKSRLKMLISRELTDDEFTMLKQDIECFKCKDEFEIYVFAEYIGHRDVKNPFRYEIYQSRKCAVREQYDVGQLVSIVSEKAQPGSEIDIEYSNVTDANKSNITNVGVNDILSLKIHFMTGIAQQVQKLPLKEKLEKYAPGFGRWLLNFGPYVVIVWVAYIAKAVVEVFIKRG